MNFIQKLFFNYKLRKVIFSIMNKERLKGRETRFREIAQELGIDKDNFSTANAEKFNMLRAKLLYYEDKVQIVTRDSNVDINIFDYLYRLTDKGVDFLPFWKQAIKLSFLHIFLPVVIAIIISYFSIKLFGN